MFCRDMDATTVLGAIGPAVRRQQDLVPLYLFCFLSFLSFFSLFLFSFFLLFFSFLLGGGELQDDANAPPVPLQRVMSVFAIRYGFPRTRVLPLPPPSPPPPHRSCVCFPPSRGVSAALGDRGICDVCWFFLSEVVFRRVCGHWPVGGERERE